MSGCWNLDDIELMRDEDDCLQFVKMIYIDLYFHKYTKIFTYVILLIHVPLWSVQMYYYIKTFDYHLVVQYGPASLVFLYAFLSMVIPLLLENHLRGALQTQKQFLWAMSVSSPEKQEDMLRKSIYFVYITKVHIALCVATYIFLLIRASKGLKWEILYQITLFRELFPEYSDIMISIFYASLSAFIIPMTCMVFVLSYLALHTSFQAEMANERLERITEEYSNSIELVYNDAYQKQVSERLGFCIVRLGALKSFSDNTLSETAPALVTYYILSILVVFCYVGTWYLDPEKYYPLLIMLVIVSCLTGLIATELGQMVEDQSMDSFSRIASLPWYTFDIKKQKDMPIMLLFAATPITLSPYEAFPINRSSLVKFYKAFTTMSTFIASTSEKISF